MLDARRTVSRHSPRSAKRCIVCALGIALWAPTSLAALDLVTLRSGGKERAVSGKVIVTAEDGGLLLMTPDGTLLTIEPQELISRKEDQEPFEPLSREQLTAKLLAELPDGFEVHATRHYLICYNTSREYASWCGSLFERLYKNFANFWTRKGFKLHDPEFPLIAVIFNSRESYAKYAEGELGKSAPFVVGYYSLRSNRMTMYDLTDTESLRGPGNRRGSAAQINRLLAQPAAEQLVATIIHEATHQIAFNSGLQTRLADIPVWLSEGIAMYFETPDLQNAKGWNTIGAVNASRLGQFEKFLATRPTDSLKSLLSDDKRMRDSRGALDAYGEAWALNYYLIRQHPKQYLAYLRLLADKKQLLWDDPHARLRDFQAAFGDNLGQLDADFVRQMQKVR